MPLAEKHGLKWLIGIKNKPCLYLQKACFNLTYFDLFPYNSRRKLKFCNSSKQVETPYRLYNTLVSAKAEVFQFENASNIVNNGLKQGGGSMQMRKLLATQKAQFCPWLVSKE